MIKTNSSNQSPCDSATSSNCISWQGGDVPCLGISNGQLLSESVYAIAIEVCALQQMLDLSTLDMKCIFDLCVSCPEPQKTLQVVLELLIKKVCDIDTLVKTLQTATSSSDNALIRLADCFQYKDTNGDTILQLPHSEYTKRIAFQVCSIRLDISSLQDDISSLNNDMLSVKGRVTALENSVGDEVTSGCLFTGTKVVPDAYELIDLAFCQLRTALGTPTDINVAIGKQPSDLSTEFGSVTGWNLAPTNLAQLISNLEIAFGSLRARVSAIENTCCAASCDDVKVGFAAVLNDAGDGITIKFTSGNGTSIPSGFTDKGSVMTVTDIHGNSEDFNVTVALNGTENLVLTALDMKSGDLKLNLSAKVGNGSLLCEKCVDKSINIDAICKFCTISATGGAGSSVTILYDDSQGVVTHATYNIQSTSTTSTTTLP